MAKLHELLAAEKTPNAAWNQMYDETLKKFKDTDHYFSGHSKSLSMIGESPENEAIEAMAREEKPVTTTVYETLQYVLDIYGNAEDLQYQKNCTNQIAKATVIYHGQELLKDLPVDQLLGLEARLVKIRQLIMAIPTLDATKHWVKAQNIGEYIWETQYPDETTKTEKTLIPVIMSPATDKHPAQIQPVSKDVVTGRYTITRRSGAATALQKANTIKVIDELLVECKKARMRANETEIVLGGISSVINQLILGALKS